MTGRKVRDRLKKLMSTAAGILGSIIVADYAGQIQLPPNWRLWISIAGIALGVGGASPVGRVVWRCPDEPAPEPVKLPPSS